jgi:hypothetical protein
MSDESSQTRSFIPSGKALDSSQALERLQLRDEWRPMITLRLWLYEIGWGGPYASWGIIYNTAGYQARRILYIRLESRKGFGAGLHYAECIISSQRVSDIEKKASYISFPALCRDHCVVLDANEYGVECHSGGGNVLLRWQDFPDAWLSLKSWYYATITELDTVLGDAGFGRFWRTAELTDGVEQKIQLIGGKSESNRDSG